MSLVEFEFTYHLHPVDKLPIVCFIKVEMSRRSEMGRSVQLSKSLSWLLRHGAEKEGFQFLPGGYLYVDSILKKPQFTRFTVEDVHSVVENNSKQRFHLEAETDTGRLKIRANQGHSLQVADLDLHPITSCEQYPVVLHGTYYKFWESIHCQGLKRMSRVHIHFAAGEPGESGVISGMRGSCDLLIYLDLQKALEAGLKFFLSANNVILSEGNEHGVISPDFFRKVVDRKTGREIDLVSKEKTGDPMVENSSEDMSSAWGAASASVTAEDLADELDSQRKQRRKKKKEKTGGCQVKDISEDMSAALGAASVSVTAEDLADELESQRKQQRKKKSAI